MVQIQAEKWSQESTGEREPAMNGVKVCIIALLIWAGVANAGIALENGMVLVTYLNQLLRDGIDLDKASVEGACLRVRPVLMTAITTALGLFPLLFSSGTGSEVQRPLATVVVGGLVTSTVLTLLVVPALYKWFAVQTEEESAGKDI